MNKHQFLWITLLVTFGIAGCSHRPTSQSENSKYRVELGEGKCAEVIYGETSALRAPNGNESTLADARNFIAAVAYARYMDDPSRFAPPQHPTADELKDPAIKKHWDLCNKAAKDGKQLDIGDCFHFFMWPIDDAGKGPTKAPLWTKDQWPYTESGKIKVRYGPFTSHIYPKSDKMYIFRYCGVTIL